MIESPDRSSCDSFVWGWVKEDFYKSEPKTLGEWEQHIQEMFATLQLDFLKCLVHFSGCIRVCKILGPMLKSYSKE